MAQPRVITVNIQKACIYLSHKPQHMIRHLASPTRQQINDPVKMHLQKASADACQTLPPRGFSTLTYQQSWSQGLRDSHQWAAEQRNVAQQMGCVWRVDFKRQFH